MKFLVVLSVAVACVVADVSQESQAPIVKADYVINPDNTYSFDTETGNGIFIREQGSLKNVNNEAPSIEVKGDFKYKSPEGPIEVSYIANEFGFQPTGPHLPVAPAIPEPILRALEYIRTHPAKQQ